MIQVQVRTQLALRPRYLVVCDLHRTPLILRGYAESANAQPSASPTGDSVLKDIFRSIRTLEYNAPDVSILHCSAAEVQHET